MTLAARETPESDSQRFAAGRNLGKTHCSLISPHSRGAIRQQGRGHLSLDSHGDAMAAG